MLALGIIVAVMLLLLDSRLPACVVSRLASILSAPAAWVSPKVCTRSLTSQSLRDVPVSAMLPREMNEVPVTLSRVADSWLPASVCTVPAAFSATVLLATIDPPRVRPAAEFRTMALRDCSTPVDEMLPALIVVAPSLAKVPVLLKAPAMSNR